MSLSMLVDPITQGLVYGIMALGVYLTFRILDFPDLTVDGSFPLGAAVAARLIVAGVSPLLATIAAIFGGMIAGVITGILNTKLKITGLLSGILTMTALYSINLRIMGRANIPLLGESTIFDLLEPLGLSSDISILIAFLFVSLLAKFIIDWFLQTELGLALRATGDNKEMIRSLGVNTDNTVILGLALSNGLVALSGSLVAQYQGFTDVKMGIGMIVIGLASVIIGEAVIKNDQIKWATLGVLLGSIVYRSVITVALRMNLNPNDLKLITALLVIGALGAPAIRSKLDNTLLAGGEEKC
ncbi:ABC transporter permease [Halanaerobacter jeridensis]|uniref:ABC transport system permease protein n=1 Tax=Halanaerobacter jeridensis TaxID=706427 RepID=A0A938XQA0_9FIRM|nr:ABC transporter permease [Halanaerobacter jeridensis]MBM7555481.1 putative ABC transport system permease protein [Halanaerobacter jeridensis]